MNWPNSRYLDDGAHECAGGIQWIYKLLSDCVTDGWGITSVVFGLTSILIWMIVSFPQMIKNCRNIRGVEGISIFLILNWTFGDTANLVGGILTQQLPLQIYLAVYFVFADLVLFAQFLYFQCWWKKRYGDYAQLSGTLNINASTQAVMCVSGLFLSVQGLLQLWQLYVPAPLSDNLSIQHHPAGRTLMADDLQYPHEVFHNVRDEIGYAIGILSSVFYVGSRLSQMYKNYKRKSTDGLSIWTFVLAVLGNLTYGMSILFRSTDGTYLLQHLPWLIGSLGIIVLDVLLLMQFKAYGGNQFDRLLREPLDQEVSIN
ncbi:hypothetical protein CHS0354_010274 [Potamilus streckersoni]|uniref:PQ-loop repeat-containing protein 2 n=1 Tax=Potamilus streckersoni TaxID=2493646 RepID=A0AAE0SVH0_9BIVA|nr:hypothetical protein CHS0354_010274 [Potamilus streckersoni]